MLSGNNGILQKATIAKEKNNEEQIKERVRLAYNSALTRDLTNGNGVLTKTTLDDEIEKEFGKDGAVTEDGDYWVISVNGVEIERVSKTTTSKRTIKFYLSSTSSLPGYSSGSGSVSGSVSGSMSGSNSGASTSNRIELEVEEGTTWLEWANDTSKETGNEQIDVIREYIRSLGTNKTVQGDYKKMVGKYTIDLYNQNYNLVNTNDSISENEAYVYLFTATTTGYMRNELDRRKVLLYDEDDNDIPIIQSYIISVKINGVESENYEIKDGALVVNEDCNAEIHLNVDGFDLQWDGHLEYFNPL